MKLIIINGPNLNLLGKRETAVYGTKSFDEILLMLKNKFPHLEIEYFQSNLEGELINKLHEVGFTFDGIIINAGAYTHTSIAIADAVKAIKTPVVEVHMSNVMQREDFRHISYLTPVSQGVIAGFGSKSYELAIQSFLINQ